MCIYANKLSFIHSYQNDLRANLSFKEEFRPEKYFMIFSRTRMQYYNVSCKNPMLSTKVKYLGVITWCITNKKKVKFLCIICPESAQNAINIVLSHYWVLFQSKTVFRILLFTCAQSEAKSGIFRLWKKSYRV